ncbi:hypothetical protein MesoLj113c_38490 [Mesorhizobium sp. 113-3-9]|nr:hypothetical protein MesoLj113c_38490 [Mesorhizobium sp. 113-3-9]
MIQPELFLDGQYLARNHPAGDDEQPVCLIRFRFLRLDQVEPAFAAGLIYLSRETPSMKLLRIAPIAILACALALTACANTIRGVGKDVKSTARAVKDTVAN